MTELPSDAVSETNFRFEKSPWLPGQQRECSNDSQPYLPNADGAVRVPVLDIWVNLKHACH
jgi:hypothetical protein